MVNKKSVGKKFLELLVVAGPLSFTELRKGLATSKNVLNYWRRRLLKRELIKREDRLYKITPMGRVVLRSKRLWNLVFSRKRVHIEEHSLYFTPELRAFPASGYLPDIPYRMAVILSSDMDVDKVLQKTVRELELDGSYFFHLLSEEIARQHGLAKHETLRPFDEISLVEDIGWAKRAYDFNMVLMIEFNGREWIRSLEKTPRWKALLEEVKKSDQHIKEWLEKVRKLANQAFKENLDKTLEKMLTEELRSADASRRAFARRFREYYADLRPCENENTLLKSIVEAVKERISSLGSNVEVTEESIWKKLIELRDKEIFKIKEITLNAIEMPKTP